MMRRQLPAYSPLDLGSWMRACLDSLRDPEGARSDLARLLSQRYPCEKVVLTGSGTQALELSIRLALRARPPKTPVALPAFSCFDVLTAAVGAGAPILFYDVDPETLAPDMESLRSTLAKGAGALVVSSLYGFPVDWDAARECCAEVGTVLIEDAAQGLGSTWKGREGGTFGDLTVLSFGRGKGWTGGGGGALLLRKAEHDVHEVLAAAVRPAPLGGGARAAAAAFAQWGVGRPRLYGLPSALPGLRLGETVYRDPTPLQAMSSFSAALVAATADAAAAEVAVRKRRAAEFGVILGRGVPPARARPLRPLGGGTSSYLRFPVVSSGSGHGVLDSPAARSLGIMQSYPRSLPELSAARALHKEQVDAFPGARELSRSLRTVPTHSHLTEGDRMNLLRLIAPGGISESNMAAVSPCSALVAGDLAPQGGRT